MPPDHPESPCAKCPYRKDAPLKLWDRIEFEQLLKTEDSQFGVVYACHNHKRHLPGDRGMCAGWLLNQKKRDVPSLMLRIELNTNEVSFAAFKKVHDGGHKLFRTVESMCRANGVRRAVPKPRSKYR